MKTIDTKAEFDQLIATEKNLIVVDFFANWCGPCKAIAPHLAKWVDEFDDVVFVKIDVDENDETAEECGISAMPTFHFYKGGKKMGHLTASSAKSFIEMRHDEIRLSSKFEHMEFLIDEIVGANHEKIKEKIVALK